MAEVKHAEIKEGDTAPNIRLMTDAGEEMELASLRGKKVVLYFYPKADTPGCTRESCGFRDQIKKFAGRGVEVIGISPDDASRQAKFKAKYELPFTLLADVDKAAAQAFGVWKEKFNYGKKYMGIERTTFIIGEDGRIAKIFPKVKVDGHIEEVLAALA
jgi:peroxiredoxin Q/BCP